MFWVETETGTETVRDRQIEVETLFTATCLRQNGREEQVKEDMTVKAVFMPQYEHNLPRIAMYMRTQLPYHMLDIQNGPAHFPKSSQLPAMVI